MPMRGGFLVLSHGLTALTHTTETVPLAKVKLTDGHVHVQELFICITLPFPLTLLFVFFGLQFFLLAL